jgi:hypothetical protein
VTTAKVDDPLGKVVFSIDVKELVPGKRITKSADVKRVCPRFKQNKTMRAYLPERMGVKV